MKVPHFGTVAVGDGELVVQDGGTHGVQGHSLRIGPEGRATWERRLEGLRAQGSAAYGSFVPSEDELRDLASWADVAWDLCARPKPPSRPPQQPRWVWCVVVRRGNEARWLADGDSAPDELKPMLDWLRRRIDGLGGS